jgi:putative ABC transport system substrate-binding protein
VKRLAAEVVGDGPDAILADRSPATAALVHETTKVPIVFAQVTDPVGQHFVASLARPGGNVTGFSDFEPSMGGKWLELLLEMAPHVRRVALACNPRTAPFAQALLPSFETAARARQVATLSGMVSSIADLETLIASLGSPADGGLVVAPDAFLTLNRDRLIASAAERRVPAIFVGPAFAQAGGLMAYGNDAVDQYRRAASYVDRILKGARAGDLPVQAPVAFSLVINLQTARTLGLTVPPTLLARADTVIE